MWRRVGIYRCLMRVLSLLAFSTLFACTETLNNDRQLLTTKKSQPTAYIIHCKTACNQVASQIESIGGRVRQQYENFNILAFELDDSTNTSKNILAQYTVVKDKQIKSPEPVEMVSFDTRSTLNAFNNIPKFGVTRKLDLSTNIIPEILETDYLEFTANDAVSLQPSGLFSNIVTTGVADAHADNILGQEIIVAIIDSGTANNSELVPLLSQSIIGGENFVMDELSLSATSTLNDPHGTWVGTMISGHGSVQIEKENPLAVSLTTHAPNSFSTVSDTHIEIPVVGTAPSSKLYALKVFPADGSGAPGSRVIAAMDRVLTLKRNFNAGLPSEPVAGDGSEESPYIYESLNIQVVNMSLGGPSLFPGYEIDDVMTNEMLDAGIVVVAAAGNEGFAAMTGGSPGTGIGSIAVGASNDVVHERVFRDVSLGEGKGILFRPTDHPQIAAFSSRGPTADGRDGVDVVANGRAVFVQSANGDMRLVSGTSFSAPTVSGAAALLWSVLGDANSDVDVDKSANDIRTALIEGARANYFLPGTTKYDKGHGLLDVDESLDILEQSNVNSHLPDKPLSEVNTKVADNLSEQGLPIFSIKEKEYEAEVTLIPGEVHQIFVETDKSTHDIIIEIDDFVTQLPLDEQNTLFGDEFILTVADATLSIDHIVLQEFILGPGVFTVTHPQPGLVRVAIMGDWTNAGHVSAEISVRRLSEVPPESSLSGTIVEGETQVFEFAIDAAVTSLNFGLSWKNDWSYYPSHDLDIIVVDPEGNVFFDGASLHSPESFSLDSPAPGLWTIHVDGFLLHNFSENFELFVNDQDSVPIPPIN